MRIAAIIALLALPAFAQFDDARLMGRWLYPGTASGSNALDSTGRTGPAVATGFVCSASSMSAGASSTAILQTKMTGTLATNESCTVTMWFKTQYVSNMALIGVNMGAPGTLIAIEVGSLGGPLGMSCRDSDSSSSDTCTITNELRDNKWHHVAAMYDGTARQIRFYYDGAPSSNATVTANSGSAAKTWTNGLGIGAIRLTGALRPFNGSIADVRLYRAALSQDEVKAIASEFVP